jgi:excisionase family DNA binding protein
MTASWDDEYLTVAEIAEHLKLNQQTLRNWIELGSLPAVRVGRRVRVRRADLDRILAQGQTAAVEPEAPTAAVAEARERLADALEGARRLLGRGGAADRAELAEGLDQLADTVADLLRVLDDDSGPPVSRGTEQTA